MVYIVIVHVFFLIDNVENVWGGGCLFFGNTAFDTSDLEL